MADERLQYDSTQGGHVVLPNQVPTYRYVSAAANQINTLVSQMKQPRRTKLIFQTLPKHMRRRAMSHNPKRLPSRLRRIHMAQMRKSGAPITRKRPSRRYRRRRCNLLAEYLRRQRKTKWLETHVWHALRFHMINRWGYRLPYASCDKNYRASYRATSQRCLLQDLSFMVCLELRGPLNVLKSGFSRITSLKCGLTITAKTYLLGKREGSVNLFRPDQYPCGALGRATFIWKPPIPESNSDCRTIWLWIHPSIYCLALKEIIMLFDLSTQESNSIDKRDIPTPITPEICSVEKDIIDYEPPHKISKLSCDKSQTDKEKTLSKVKVEPKKIPVVKRSFKNVRSKSIQCYNNPNTGVYLKNLKDQFNRYRLTGPLSHAVLSNAFKAKDANISNETKVEEDPNWFEEYLEKHPNFHSLFDGQAKFWQSFSKINDAAHVLSNIVVALNIIDPRIYRPLQRKKCKPGKDALEENDTDTLTNSFNLPYSAIWEDYYRDRFLMGLLTTAELNKRRAKHVVVPGETCKFEDKIQPIPVLIIQRPGTSGQVVKESYGCGWDVIVPAGCGMSVWLTLVMNGGKPGGLREFHTIARESGAEEHLPDTLAGQVCSGERYVELREKYFSLPPNKRCNYNKLSVVSPFRAPFRQLLLDWQPTKSLDDFKTFFVLRDRKVLQQLNTCIMEKISTFPVIEERCRELDYLIQVRLRMKTRGNPKEFSLICLPTPRDFKKNLRQIYMCDNKPVFVEPLADDTNEIERKLLRKQHKQMLKRMRARRVRTKREEQKTSKTRVKIQPANTSSLVHKYNNKMRELWLPENAESFSKMSYVRNQGQREVIGYITTANFSYAQATVCAIGYVTNTSLQALMLLCKEHKHNQLACLVRDTNSRNYRFASLALNLDV